MFGYAPELPQSESTPFRPRNRYGAAKVFAHAVVEMYRKHFGVFAWRRFRRKKAGVGVPGARQAGATTARSAGARTDPADVETPRTLPNLTQRLLDRGYSESESDVSQVLGRNGLRVMPAVWG